jgi:hypothetical protein
MVSGVVKLKVDQPAIYQIKLLGRLGDQWAVSLDNFAITATASDGALPVTTLEGRVADQAALFGLLSRIRDLGLPLLLVECLSGEPPEPTTR